MKPAPQVSAHALEFLASLGRDDFEFRCFADPEDQKQRNPPQRFIGSFEKHKGKLRQLNDRGYGIFVQVNESDGKGNKAGNITRAPTFFVDLDGAPRENIERLKLKPHSVVSTSPGKYHAYWLVKDIPIDQFKGVQQRLAALMDSDKSVCDLPRVMRLPGFLHQKDPNAPYVVNPLLSENHPAFTFEEFQSALSAAEAEHCPLAGANAKLDKPTNGIAGSDALSLDESMLRFLMHSGALNLAQYKTWIELGIALKNTHQEAGFELWHSLSCDADNYDGEEACRRAWDGIVVRPSQAEQLTTATYWKRATDAGYRPTKVPKPRGTPGGATSGAGGGKADQATKVIAAANEAGDERFLDTEGTPYVRFRQKVGQADEHWVTSRIDSELYGQVLKRRFFLDAVTKTLAPEQLKSAQSLLAAEAVENGVRHPVYLRSGWHEGRLYVDLGRGNGQAIEVDGRGFRTVNEAPIRFIQGSRGALPMPESGGSIADLQRHLPALEPSDVQKVLAFAIATFIAEGTYPMLLFSGGQGTFKSTMGDIVLAITDPPTGRRDARFSFTNKEQDLLIHASSARVLYFDNVSSFGPRESDLLCRLLSGAAFSTRVLYTNGEEYRIALRRPIVATSIETPTRRGDLLDRMLPVTARRPAQRRTEEEVWNAFEVDKPMLFGLVLTGISHAIRNRDKVAASVSSGDLKLPRLADFAAFVEGAADVLELAPGEFCAMLRHEQAGMQAEAAADDPLGAALVQYFSGRHAVALDVTAAELLDALPSGNDYRRDWPSTNKVRGRLQRIEPGLRDIGIDLRFSPPKGKRNVWTMQIAATDQFFPNQTRKTPF